MQRKKNQCQICSSAWWVPTSSQDSLNRENMLALFPLLSTKWSCHTQTWSFMMPQTISGKQGPQASPTDIPGTRFCCSWKCRLCILNICLLFSRRNLTKWVTWGVQSRNRDPKQRRRQCPAWFLCNRSQWNKHTNTFVWGLDSGNKGL